ncbi:MAG: hypothetical protein FWE05_02905 [Defluviitaleaceae bacterium]|nr:hypothetical protein [Defluviitaleaceae bacterium]
MEKKKRSDKTKEKYASVAVYEDPRDGFENYRSGIEITNQVAMDDEIIPD